MLSHERDTVKGANAKKPSRIYAKTTHKQAKKQKKGKRKVKKKFHLHTKKRRNNSNNVVEKPKLWRHPYVCDELLLPTRKNVGASKHLTIQHQHHHHTN